MERTRATWSVPQSDARRQQRLKSVPNCVHWLFRPWVLQMAVGMNHGLNAANTKVWFWGTTNLFCQTQPSEGDGRECPFLAKLQDIGLDRFSKTPPPEGKVWRSPHPLASSQCHRCVQSTVWNLRQRDAADFTLRARSPASGKQCTALWAWRGRWPLRSMTATSSKSQREAATSLQGQLGMKAKIKSRRHSQATQSTRTLQTLGRGKGPGESFRPMEVTRWCTSGTSFLCLHVTADEWICCSNGRSMAMAPYDKCEATPQFLHPSCTAYVVRWATSTAQWQLFTDKLGSKARQCRRHCWIDAIMSLCGLVWSMHFMSCQAALPCNFNQCSEIWGFLYAICGRNAATFNLCQTHDAIQAMSCQAAWPCNFNWCGEIVVCLLCRLFFCSAALWWCQNQNAS